MLKKILFIVLIVGTAASRASEKSDKDDKDDVPVKEGNLALSSSQQPGPLFSFGQNMVDKGDFQTLVVIDYIKGRRKHFNDFIPTILYGITNNLSLFAYQPFANFKIDCQRSSGPEDMFVQFEYAFHTKIEPRYFTQATVVGALILPVGSYKKQPETGFGSPSVFLGLTASYNGVDWYAFACPGALLPTSHHGTKFGNIFFYECGFGHNITYIPQKMIFMWMIEFFGIYRQKNVINYKTDLNSGSNIFYVGPSLWFSTDRFLLQAGIAVPVAQHFNGSQRKNNYYADLYMGWKFNT